MRLTMNSKIKKLDQLLSQLDRRLELQNHQESEKHLTVLIDYTETHEHGGFPVVIKTSGLERWKPNAIIGRSHVE